MKYKLVVSDFDGTLLKDDFTVSDRAIKAINKYISLGGNFIICTGRMKKSLDKWINIMGMDKQKITTIGFQGALITDSRGKILYNENIGYEEAYRIIKRSEELGIYSHIYDANNLYVAEKNEINTFYCDITDITMEVVGRLSDFILKNKFCPVKMMWVVDENESDRLISEISPTLNDSHCFMSSETYLEFVSKNSSKGNAIKVVCDLLGIDKSECIAIGDQMNDLPMIKQAGVGIAVKNARKEVCQQADYVTLSNNDDGVAVVLEKLIEEIENG